MSLYSAFLSMAPFILLAVKWGADDTQEWSYAALWDVVLVLSVITGGIVSTTVTVTVLAPTLLQSKSHMLTKTVSTPQLSVLLLPTRIVPINRSGRAWDCAALAAIHIPASERE